MILVATLLALLLAWVLNHYFIRSRLVKRFTALNQAVVQIGLGRTDATIPVYGRDELGRIAGLLRHTLGQLNAQKQQLEQEIAERKTIEADLRATQDELIQTAKLAVVGQTMTTLAHEINQPLNALSMYLFTAGRAIEQGLNWKRRCIRLICVRRLRRRGNCWRCAISLSRGRSRYRMKPFGSAVMKYASSRCW